MAVGASSSRNFEAERSTNNGAVIAEDTTDGVPTTEEPILGNGAHNHVDRRCFVP